MSVGVMSILRVLKLTFVLLHYAAQTLPATNSSEPSYAGVTDTYAVVEIGGHQLIVEEGRWYSVNRLEVR